MVWHRHSFLVKILSEPILSVMILGDNIFYGHGFGDVLLKAAELKKGACIFGYYVNDPERYGVVEFDKSLKA